MIRKIRKGLMLLLLKTHPNEIRWHWMGSGMPWTRIRRMFFGLTAKEKLENEETMRWMWERKER